MTDEELIDAIISFKAEVKAEALDSQLEKLGSKLANTPVCTTLEKIEKNEKNSELTITTSAKSYKFDLGETSSALIAGLSEADLNKTDKYTSTLSFTNNISVNNSQQNSVVLTWQSGVTTNGRDAEEIFSEDKYNKHKPKTYDNGTTKYKFSTAGVSASATGVSGSVTGASFGLTGADFSVCGVEDVFRVYSLFGAVADVGVTLADENMAVCKSRIWAFLAHTNPISAVVRAIATHKRTFKVNV